MNTFKVNRVPRTLCAHSKWRPHRLTLQFSRRTCGWCSCQTAFLAVQVTSVQCTDQPDNDVRLNMSRFHRSKKMCNRYNICVIAVQQLKASIWIRQNSAETLLTEYIRHAYKVFHNNDGTETCLKQTELIRSTFCTALWQTMDNFQTNHLNLIAKGGTKKVHKRPNCTDFNQGKTNHLMTN